jgi:hypothetical protein
LLQFAAVNVQLLFNTRLLKVRYWPYAVHQILCVASFLAVAAIAAVAPQARVVRGDRFASVATGLGVFARRVFEGAPA